MTEHGRMDHQWTRKNGEDHFQPCECGEPPPDFADTIPSKDEWPDDPKAPIPWRKVEPVA